MCENQTYMQSTGLDTSQLTGRINFILVRRLSKHGKYEYQNSKSEFPSIHRETKEEEDKLETLS